MPNHRYSDNFRFAGGPLSRTIASISRAYSLTISIDRTVLADSFLSHIIRDEKWVIHHLPNFEGDDHSFPQVVLLDSLSQHTKCQPEYLDRSHNQITLSICLFPFHLHLEFIHIFDQVLPSFGNHNLNGRLILSYRHSSGRSWIGKYEKTL
ncbi:hypothetical protein BDZ97DRAFT_1160687 [Flammula alnicola]|nr:hypothetical protein BDZ97DRAFT_1160687 [Flammula alnicola]